MISTNTTYTWNCDLCGAHAVQEHLTRFKDTDICETCLTRPISFFVEHGTSKAKMAKAGARLLSECIV